MRESTAFEGGALLLESKKSAGEMGHRIAKHVYTSADVWEKNQPRLMKTQQRQASVRMLQGTTYYVLDAQGKRLHNSRRRQAGELAPLLGGTLSTYEYVNDNQTQTLTYAQTEKHIYGSSRLGVNTEVVPMFGSQNATYSMKLVLHKIGQRTHELSNHLGNVLSIISDKVIPHQNGSSVDYWQADFRHSQDYSPFGAATAHWRFTLHGRDLSLSTTGNKPYRYGFQNQEEDAETGLVNYTFRMQNPRLGRFFAIDPLIDEYPHQSSYQFSSNQPIHTFELEGAESNNELSINVGLTANIGLNGSNTNIRGFVGISGNIGKGTTQGNYSASVAMYSGGLGTTQGTTGKSGFFMEANFSIGLNQGFAVGKTTSNGIIMNKPLVMNNYYQESGVRIENPFVNSFILGLNSTFTITRPTQHFNDPKYRTQVNGYFGGKLGDFAITNYNDLYTSFIHIDDSYWTGGMEAKYEFSDNSILSFTYDCFTGKRPRSNGMGVRQTRVRGGQKYYGGSGGVRDLYNNGQTTLKYTSVFKNGMPYGIGLAHIGHGKGNGQWQQNGIHKHYPGAKIPLFMNNSLESLLLNMSIGY